MTTSPDVKLFIKATDRNMNNNNVFGLEDYVDVQADFSSGCNRPTGCGFVEKVDDNLLSVRYTSAHDVGRRHNNIPAFMALSDVLYQDMMMKSEGKNRENRNES